MKDSKIEQDRIEVELLEAVRLSHRDLQESIKNIQDEQLRWAEYIPWAWVEKHFVPFAEALYKAHPHWHLWDGQCIKPVPFELRIGTLGIFYSLWFYDIMLRKARDRKSPRSRVAIEEWRLFLNRILDLTRDDIDSTRDIDAETRHQETAKPIKRIRHWLNTLLWKH